MKLSGIRIAMADYTEVACLQTECAHNGLNNRSDEAGCNLKRIAIDSEGKCYNFAEKRTKGIK